MADTCRRAGISQATYFNWKKKYDSLPPTKMRLKQLADETSMLRKVDALGGDLFKRGINLALVGRGENEDVHADRARGPFCVADLTFGLSREVYATPVRKRKLGALRNSMDRQRGFAPKVLVCRLALG